MSNTNKLTVQDVLNRISELNDARRLVDVKTNEVEVHTKDLKAQEVVTGVNSDEYKVKKEILDSTQTELDDAIKHVDELSFTKSELKPHQKWVSILTL